MLTRKRLTRDVECISYSYRRRPTQSFSSERDRCSRQLEDIERKGGKPMAGEKVCGGVEVPTEEEVAEWKIAE